MPGRLSVISLGALSVTNHDHAAKSFADAFIDAFRLSDYPNSCVIFNHKHGFVEVRHPPRLLSGLTSYAQLPAIEVIELSQEIRGKGVLTRTISGILEQPEVVGVCLSHVSNARLLTSVKQWGWHRLATLFSELPTFYTVKDFEYRCALRSAGPDAFDERSHSPTELDQKHGFDSIRQSLLRSFRFPN